MRFLAEMRRCDIAGHNLENDIILFPLGPVENHGDHLPAGTDIFISGEIARGLAVYYAKGHPHARVLVYPTIPVAGASIRGVGSVKSSSKQIGDVLFSLSRRYLKQGFARFVFISVHGGVPFVSALDAVCRRLNRKGAQALAPLSKVAFNSFAGNYNARGKEKTVNLPENFDDLRTWDLHAGCWETSMMLAARPDLVGDQYKTTPDIHVKLPWWIVFLKNTIRGIVDAMPLSETKKKEIAVGLDVGALDLAWIVRGRPEGYHGAPSRSNADFGNALIEISVEDIAEYMHDVFENKSDPKKYRSGMFFYNDLMRAGLVVILAAIAFGIWSIWK